MNATTHAALGVGQGSELVGQVVHEFVGVIWPTVGHVCLDVRPDHFHRVEFRRIRRECFQVEPWKGGTDLADGPGLMDACVVPQDDDGTTQMGQQVTQKIGHMFRFQVVGREIEVKAQPAFLWAQGKRGDDRNAVAAVSMLQDRGLAFGRPGLSDLRDEEESGFVNEDEMGAQVFGVFFTRGNSSRVQRSISASFRSIARRSGFWYDHPRFPIRRPI